ncbi:unnamed protein product [Cyprideis torosa]|uniref:Uncharacterized protein n=1 Tax=Cyprideis torosa TaxID=163714 RepID=A0A7R8ZZN2_9CRUS|nr:unnamed protein product [Cyprideis torosa]CAG0909840.1 unnamed protein product [Cyprideis torosa]
MIPGIEHGRYQMNTKRIRETMRVIQTPLDLSRMNLGRYIPGTCKDKLTYRLAKIGGPDQWLSRKRRSLGTAPRSPIVFREFTGNGVAEFEIYGI